MIKKRTDPMVYQPEMEKIDSDIRDKVLKNVDKYDDQKITTVMWKKP